ncbi:MAG TPA: hypothetical protein VKU01_11620 [Bryobacteraceae bacterium]|nr:hypothetical protein [Bryobacteraceae bacterium]
MDIRKAIDDLRFSLEHITAEEQLLQTISEQLIILRQSFGTYRRQFTLADIDFLRSLSPIAESLQSFIGLREELEAVDSLHEHAELVGRLKRIRNVLGDLPLSRKINKELRELNDKRDRLFESDQARRNFRLDSRVTELNLGNRGCKHNHPMAIRKGALGFFWGCTHYPFCQETARLSQAQIQFLGDVRP